MLLATYEQDSCSEPSMHCAYTTRSPPFSRLILAGAVGPEQGWYHLAGSDWPEMVQLVGPCLTESHALSSSCGQTALLSPSRMEPRSDLCFPQGQEVKAQPGLGNKQRDHQEDALSSHPRSFSEIPTAQPATPVPHLLPPIFLHRESLMLKLSWSLMTQLSLGQLLCVTCTLLNL